MIDFTGGTTLASRVTQKGRACLQHNGSVSAVREKRPFFSFFFLKWKARVAKPSDIDDFFRFAVTYDDLGMPQKLVLTLPFQ